MSIEILDCLKRKRNIYIKTIIPSQNTAFMWTPALRERFQGHSSCSYCQANVNKITSLTRLSRSEMKTAIAWRYRTKISLAPERSYASCESKGHVTRSDFSCNLQRNKRSVASCKEKFTCNTPFCNCNCCVASCKKSRTTLYFSQRCETSCLRVTSSLQLTTQFCQSGPIRAHRSQDVGD